MYQCTPAERGRTFLFVVSEASNRGRALVWSVASGVSCGGSIYLGAVIKLSKICHGCSIPGPGLAPTLRTILSLRTLSDDARTGSRPCPMGQAQIQQAARWLRRITPYPLAILAIPLATLGARDCTAAQGNRHLPCHCLLCRGKVLPSVIKQEVYRRKMVARREHWYLDIGPTKDQWKAMSADQRAVHRRWYNFYRKRRVMRELLQGTREQ